MIDYFTNYIKGEIYNYGLKCTSPSFEVDEHEIVFIAQGEKKKICIVHDSNARKFLQVHAGFQSKVDVEVILIAKENCTVDSYIEILHEGNGGRSTLTVRGYTEGNGRIISRIRTHVPHEASHVHATQSVQLYQFGAEGDSHTKSTLFVEPLMGIEPMTTVLPRRYSTTELQRLRLT